MNELGKMSMVIASRFEALSHNGLGQELVVGKNSHQTDYSIHTHVAVERNVVSESSYWKALQKNKSGQNDLLIFQLFSN